jgi:hypothetical protein
MQTNRWIVGALVLAACTPLACGGGGEEQKSSFALRVEAGLDGTFFGDANYGDVSPTPIFGMDSGTPDVTPIPTDAQGVFAISPSGPQTISVTAGQSMPAVPLTATFSGLPVAAGWNVDRGDLGTVTTGPSSTSTFTPSGSTGGLVTVTAGFNGMVVTTQIFVKLTANQSGADPGNPSEQPQIATTPSQLTVGGGIGGVGGEGLGGPVTDAPTLAALGSPSSNGSAQALTFLYPYDKTVWPRGMLAPLLMWQWAVGDADAIQISIATTSGSFSWTGTFGRPGVLAAGQSFIRHPIPQDVWDMATNTAGGPTPSGTPDNLTVSLTVAKAIAQDGGTPAVTGFGPISETWVVAPGRLPGVIYYNSYGTLLVQNSIEHQYQNGPQFGAAVLSIAQGATAPSVVAGTPSPLGSGAGCRVCHVVSSDGSRLIAQHGDNYSETSTYDLKNGNAETVLAKYNGVFGWAGLSADGSLALTSAVDLAAGAGATQLFAFPPTSTTPLTVTGIPANLKGGTPTFSPDDKHVAFDFVSGTIGTATGNGTQLVAMDFDKATNTFSNLTVLATMTGGKRAGFPSFFPTNDAVAFHYQIVNANHRYNTWMGAEAQIWWSDLATGTATSLDALNGLSAGGTTSYLPTGPNRHANDTVLNYEPTVTPEASGGYIWVIFTSRRLYGNLATTDPWQSDPRNYDATVLANTTCKKLWVAAIDLSPTAGSDPSHPAFYLPAQELLAGNSRGFWVLAPCRKDGQSCMSGDQCCNGYCEPLGDGGALICANTPPNNSCSTLNNKCVTAADCCDAANKCVNGFCTQSTVPQ